MSMLLEQFDTIFDTQESIGKLQELILDMAVKGRLVPQDPNDEPASMLLEKIKAEKESLIKEKKIKKEKQPPSVAEEDINYELPRGWSWVKLGQIGQIVGGGTPNTKVAEYFSENEVAWLTPADLNGLKDKYIGSGRRYISKLGLEKSSAQLLPKGSVLFSSRAPIGYVAIALNDLSTNQGFKSCVPYILELNEYLYYYLKHIAKKVDEKASGTTFKEVSGKIVSNLSLALPPLNEQKRIVKKVDQLMSFCEELKKRLEKKQKREERLNVSAFSSLEQSLTPEELKRNLQFVLTNFSSFCTDTKHVQQLRKTILSLAVKGKLVTQDSTDEPASVLLGKIAIEKELLIKEKKIKKEKTLPPIAKEEKTYELPRGWEWARLNDICYKITDGSHNPPPKRDSGYAMISAKNIKSGQVNLSNVDRYVNEEEFIRENKRTDISKNDLLLGIIGASIGNTAIYNLDLSVVAQRSLAILGTFLDVKFLKIVLDSPLIQKKLKSETSGTAQGGVYLGTIRRLVIPLPTLNEQRRIVEKVDQLMVLCDEFEKQVKHTNEKKAYLLKSVLYQAFQ